VPSVRAIAVLLWRRKSKESYSAAAHAAKCLCYARTMRPKVTVAPAMRCQEWRAANARRERLRRELPRMRAVTVDVF